MIEYQINPAKRLIFRIVALVLIAAFLWYDISWAGDLFYYNSFSHTEHDRNLQSAREVTNREISSSDRRKSGLGSVMPSSKDREQSSTFAPGYIQQQQSKHDNIVNQKQDISDNIGAIDDQLRRKTKKEDEGLELKKKKGGSDVRPKTQEGQMPDYTLNEFDENGNPTTMDVYEKNEDGSLRRVVRYDISGKDASKWKDGTKDIGKDGEKILASYGKKADISELTEDDILSETYYTGSKGKEKIDYVLSDFDEGKAGKITTYGYDGDKLKETRSYDVSG